MSLLALALPPPPNARFAAVTDVRHYSDRLFAFSCERPASFRFRSGEFVMLGLPSGERPLLRAYSVASPAWSDELAFYSIKVKDGPLTSRLAQISAGDLVLIGRKATGTLVLDALRPGRRLFLLSTGTGIAPFASLIHDPETYERYEQVILTQTCRTSVELAFAREQVAAAHAHPLIGEVARGQLRFVSSLTQERHALTGRITDLIESEALFAALKARPLDPRHDRVMICGSSAMVADLRGMLLTRGFEEGSNQQPGDFVFERAFVDR